MEQFREMRRKRQQLSEEESISILCKSTAGTLALPGETTTIRMPSPSAMSMPMANYISIVR